VTEHTETLRRAASLMRARAEAASESPWRAWDAQEWYGNVALAVADLLDMHAQGIEDCNIHERFADKGAAWPEAQPNAKFMAVARAYLETLETEYATKCRDPSCSAHGRTVRRLSRLHREVARLRAENQSLSVIEQVLALHRPVQWTGWQLWASRLACDPRAYFDRWCRGVQQALALSHRQSSGGEMTEHTAEKDAPEVGSLWQRNPPGREVVEVRRAWNYSPMGGPAVPTVRAHPKRGGRPLVAPVEWFIERYTRVIPPGEDQS